MSATAFAFTHLAAGRAVDAIEPARAALAISCCYARDAGVLPALDSGHPSD